MPAVADFDLLASLSGPARPAAAGLVRLWIASLHATSADEILDMLSAEERARAQRFAFERDRRRYVAAHALLRQVLAVQTGLSPEALQLIASEFGKPALEAPAPCVFNMSHSGDVIVIAVAARGEIGVDVEVQRAVTDAVSLAERNFTESERAVLMRVAPSDRDRAFLRGWTRKEACLKALGCGLAVAPQSFDAGVSPDPRDVVIDAPSGRAIVNVQSLDEAGGLIVALARVLGASLPGRSVSSEPRPLRPTIRRRPPYTGRSS